jgi:pimeloyl-ACP methyl ester carboxylesterase
VVPADALAEMERAGARGDRESVVEIGLRRCVRIPDEQVDRIKTMPIWQDMVRHGATWPREMRAIYEKEAGVQEYAKINARTLLPVGAMTPQHHRTAAEALLVVMPDARLVEIAGTAHQGHREAPDDLARELTAFLH